MPENSRRKNKNISFRLKSLFCISFCQTEYNIIYFHASGNDAIHLLTKIDQELRVGLLSFSGEKAYALYSAFQVEDENSKFRLTVSGYSGTAGMYVLHILNYYKTKHIQITSTISEKMNLRYKNGQ